MPIVTASAQQRNFRPSWVLALLAISTLVFLVLVGVVGWSWDHPVALQMGGRHLRLGRTAITQSYYPQTGWHPEYGYFAIDVPGNSNWYIGPYVISWHE